jgi:ABC-type amino acid transport substrate-binding protein
MGARVSADVFISHAESDSKIADAVCARLEARGIRCWIAPRDIEPGRNWPKAVLKAIKTTRIMVVILSHNANESPHVYREVERAVDDGDAILPFRIEDVKPSDNMELFLGSCHWLDAISPPVELHIQALATRIESLLESRPPDSSSRQARESVVKAAGHIPKSPHSVNLRYQIGAALTTGIFSAAAVAWFLVQSDAPTLLSPADNEVIIEPEVTYEWEYEAADRSGIIYQVLQSYDGDDSDIASVVALALNTRPKSSGEIHWLVRATWSNGDKDDESGWSDERTVTWYPDTLTKVRETGVLNVAIAEEAVRFIKPNGDVTGYELEYLRQALTPHFMPREGAELEIKHSKVFPFDQSFFDSLDASKYDVMVGGISITDERERKWNVKFTEPLYEYPQTFVYLKGQEDPICLGEVEPEKECRIGVKSGTTNEKLATRLKDEYPGVMVVSYNEATVYRQMAKDLRGRRIELALMDQPYALELLSLQNGKLFEYLPIVDGVIRNAPPPERIGIATKIFDHDLRAVLNGAINEVRPEVEAILAGLEQKGWNGTGQPVSRNNN